VYIACFVAQVFYRFCPMDGGDLGLLQVSEIKLIKSTAVRGLAELTLRSILSAKPSPVGTAFYYFGRKPGVKTQHQTKSRRDDILSLGTQVPRPWREEARVP
jgi:hypothetical protein